MMYRHLQMCANGMVIVALSMLPLIAGGCENLPGGPSEQGAVIGGGAGAAGGAVIAGEENRVEGALIGGALGALGGWLVGSQQDKDDDVEGARESATQAQEDPATAAEARAALTADINNDGFVTLDEIVAMQNAGLTDDVMINRIEDTGHVFNLTPSQQDYLLDRGVSYRVVTAMENMNEGFDDNVNTGSEVISG